MTLRPVQDDESRCPARSAAFEVDCELIAGHDGPHLIRRRPGGAARTTYAWYTGHEAQALADGGC